LRKLREGDWVEAKGTWDEDGGVFLVYEIEKLPKPHFSAGASICQVLRRLFFRRNLTTQHLLLICYEITYGASLDSLHWSREYHHLKSQVNSAHQPCRNCRFEFEKRCQLFHLREQ
jgi:hypothetical protein